MKQKKTLQEAASDFSDAYRELMMEVIYSLKIDRLFVVLTNILNRNSK